ncbi:hypothetical protein [Parabacteroides sp. PF5-9]|uniref:hypothetical protein n=1 Tax=Parabacteroides sp. PF5-9 TaxID=1742404 RepID=UPI0024751130|nr:hypothetical protein [Parabacteroides sp. PF5-9]MDH6358964.1 hypothetical protein [Parabacteroides sp. PF5-9]
MQHSILNKMINCRVVVKNDYGVGEGENDPYYLEIQLPALPFIGMYLFVDLSPLEEMVRQNLEVATRFFSNDMDVCYFYNSYKDNFDRSSKQREDITEDDLKHLSFGDVNWVSNIFMKANCNYVYIELCAR